MTDITNLLVTFSLGAAISLLSMVMTFVFLRAAYTDTPLLPKKELNETHEQDPEEDIRKQTLQGDDLRDHFA